MGDSISFRMISEKLVPYHQIYHTFSTRNYNLRLIYYKRLNYIYKELIYKY